ncbi:DUF1570 domain-containing protein [Pseudoalteromonas rubra]|uniref:DUF4124 domain-containing protein n=1 Tax=Pseudoalteromonas rubra TaxID=43658 RepID=A0A5S3X5J4_9GAMM|nr:DUF1570 domain-containing protein [Pseudoalteromonas rubra]TMP39549.1 hypothetical protein CWB98_02880 [Pseudoalteromonas rubra]
MKDWISNLLLLVFVLFAVYMNRALIADFFGVNIFPLPDMQNQTAPETSQPLYSTQTTTRYTSNEPEAEHSEHTSCGTPVLFQCNSASLGKVKIQIADGIYTWQDERGITHYSDRPPEQGAMQYRFKSNQALDYFELDLDPGAQSTDFRNRLEAKLNAVFRTYSGIIGLEAMRKVKLRIVVANNRSAYIKMLDVLGASPKGNQGIYVSKHNVAVVEYRNEAQAMRTAVHEAVHAINQAVLGNSPRWFNEGIAEYFEYIETSMNLSKLKPNRSWVRNDYLVGTLVHPNSLFEAAGSWRGKAQSRMYKSSWAFMYYLMSSQRGRAQLKHYMRLEQKNPCNLLRNSQIQSIFETGAGQFANSYAQLTRQRLTAHRF